MNTEYCFCSVMESPQMASRSFCLSSGPPRAKEIRMSSDRQTRRNLIWFCGIRAVISHRRANFINRRRVLEGRCIAWILPEISGADDAPHDFGVAGFGNVG